MPKPIVTPELVSEAADALLAAGEEPSIITVQARIGAGSYTTIKRYLDAWKQQRNAQPPAPVAPPALAEQGAAFVRDLWAAAQAQAGEQVAEARAQARRQVEEARAAQAGAEAALEQLEAQAEAQAQALAERDQAITALHAELAQARADLGAAQARADEIQRQTQDLRADRDRLQAGGRAEVERLATELAALKDQVAQALRPGRRG